ncbi:helix-turn-helix domain-containing protein [Culicoidibacter larvae]|uniref:DeoR family transcriptional regulator n=1 Tax=Culicoidibacter larvae TaxID=2579976 RepID=A0A5R8QGW2_9FIRM|nr:helix-turn-helix domain-containing protein [Culicoidibacter larvae]TLG77255.1 DeoR family transcriptional regulator [Culicoidibacter larvae]
MVTIPLLSKEHLEKDIYRKISIINYLVEHPLCTISDLCGLLDVSENTIRNDLQAIKLDLPENWEIHITKGHGISITKPIDQTLSILSSQLWSETLIFKTIFLLLREDTITINELTERLFANARNIKTVLAHLEMRLSSYGLVLQRAPLQIVGTEIAIRYFFFDHIQYFFGNESWRLDTLNKEIPYIDFMKNAADLLEVKYNCSIPIHHKWDYILYICIMIYRNVYQHKIQFRQGIDDFMQSIPEFYIAKDIMDLLVLTFPEISFNNGDTYHITFPLLSNVEIQTYLGPEIPKTMQVLAKQFQLDTITTEFILNLGKTTDIALTSPQTYTVMRKKIQLQLLKYLINFSFPGFVQNELTEDLTLATAIKIAYQPLIKTYNLPELYNTDIVDIISIIHNEQLIKRNKKNILIIMSGGQVAEETIRTLLASYLGESYFFEISNESLSSTLANQQHLYHAIISDITASADITTPMLSIHNQPTKIELQNIVNFLLLDMFESIENGA